MSKGNVERENPGFVRPQGRTAEDFVNDNRQFAGEYAASPGKGESQWHFECRRNRRRPRIGHIHIVDRETGEMTAYSQAYKEKLGLCYPDVTPVPMKEARGARLIEYFRYLNLFE